MARTSPDYFSQFEDRKAAQAIEDEEVERAMVGVFEPNLFQGRFCYPQEKYVARPAVTASDGSVIEAEGSRLARCTRR